MKRKLVVFCLVMALLMSLAACTKTTPEPSPAVSGTTSATSAATTTEPAEVTPQPREQFSFTALVNGLGADTPDTPVNKAWQEKLNEVMGMDITINWTYTPGAEYDDKMKVLLTSGQLPDYFLLPFIYDYVPMANQGIFLDLAKYGMPNYLKWVDQAVDGRMKAFTDTGLLPAVWCIGVPTVEPNKSNTPMNISVFNVTAFEREKIELPVTLDDWYNAAKQFKAKYPNSFPINMNYIGVFTVFSAHRIYANELGAGTCYWNGKNWTFAGLQPEYKTGIEYLRKLYAEGLLDPEYIIETVDTVKSKMFNEVNFMLLNSWVTHASEYTRDAGGEQQFAAGINVSNPDSGLPYLAFGRANEVSMSNWTVHAVNAKTANPEVMAKIVDAQYLPDLYEITTWGVEGTTYVTEADGKRYSDEILNASPVDRPMIADKYGIWMTGKVNPGLRGIQFNKPHLSLPYDNVNDYSFVGGKLEHVSMDRTEYFSKLPWPNDHIPPWFDAPAYNLNENEANEHSQLSTVLETWTKQMQAEFISGKRSMDEWDSFIETFKTAYSIDRILEIREAATKRYFDKKAELGIK